VEYCPTWKILYRERSYLNKKESDNGRKKEKKEERKRTKTCRKEESEIGSLLPC
jgi:hypothetical protein